MELLVSRILIIIAINLIIKLYAKIHNNTRLRKKRTISEYIFAYKLSSEKRLLLGVLIGGAYFGFELITGLVPMLSVIITILFIFTIYTADKPYSRKHVILLFTLVGGLILKSIFGILLIPSIPLYGVLALLSIDSILVTLVYLFHKEEKSFRSQVDFFCTLLIFG